MADNPGGKIAPPAFAATAHWTKQFKKRPMYKDDHLKERVTTDTIKREPGDGQNHPEYMFKCY